jgi:CRP/FNR family transcriptional regulator, cyclic AMP receptor protein
MNMSADLLEKQDAQPVAVELLPDYPLFRGLSGHHRQILAECLERATFKAGETVVETGEPTDRFYVVTSGSIDLESPGALPNEKVQTVGPGGILGWSWLFPPYFWHVNAVAKERTEALFFSTSRLCQACYQDREFGFQLFKFLSPATAALASSRESTN